jgi:hypothetical protein
MEKTRRHAVSGGCDGPAGLRLLDRLRRRARETLRDLGLSDAEIAAYQKNGMLARDDETSASDSAVN